MLVSGNIDILNDGRKKSLKPKQTSALEPIISNIWRIEKQIGELYATLDSAYLTYSNLVLLATRCSTSVDANFDYIRSMLLLKSAYMHDFHQKRRLIHKLVKRAFVQS